MRLLLVSHHFPPDTAVGSKRAKRIAVWMNRLGWDVDVVAAGPEFQFGNDQTLMKGLEGVHLRTTWALNVRYFARVLANRKNSKQGGEDSHQINYSAVREGGRFRGIRELIKRFLTIVEQPDQWIGWLPFAVWEGRRLRRPDVVVATLPAYTNALAGALLSRYWRVPLVIDYRDPWTAGIKSDDLSFVKRIGRKLENFCLSSANRCVATTDGIAETVGVLAGKNCSVVLNSCDLSSYESAGIREFQRPTIVYTGSLYGSRNLDAIVDALERCKTEYGFTRESFRLLYMGPSASYLESKAVEKQVSDIVKIEGMQSHDKALAALKGATCNLLVVGSEHRIQIPAKLFEQIVSSKPLLVICHESCDVAKLLSRYRVGLVCSPNDQESIVNALIDIRDGSCRSWTNEKELIEVSSEKKTMARLDSILRACLKKQTI